MKVRILIVEDEITTSMHLQELLVPKGYDVMGTAVSAEEALRIVDSDPPDVILMDIRLEGKMDGIDAAKEINRKYGIPVIFITAHINNNLIKRARKADPYGYILKPVSSGQLLFSLEMSLKRHSLERRLGESHELFKGITENIPLMIFRFIPGSMILSYINDNFCSYFGKKRDKLLGTVLFKWLPKEDYHFFTEHLKSININNPIITFEQRLNMKNGIRWQRWTCQAIADEKGNVTQFQSIGEDITDRKWAEEEIKNLARFPSEDPNPVLRVSSDGRILYANMKSYYLLKNWENNNKNFLPPEMIDYVKSVLDTGSNLEVDIESGQEMYLVVFVPFVNAGYVNIYGMNITERKRASDALACGEMKMRQQSELLRKTFDSIPDALFILDEKTPPRIVECNKAACLMFRYEREDLTERDMGFMFKDKESTETFQTILYGYFRQNKTGIFHLPEYKLKRGNNEIFMSEHFISQLMDDQGNSMGWVSVVRDISPQKEMQKEIRKSHKEIKDLYNNLQEVREMERRHLAREIHDELGQSMTALNMDLSWLKKRVPDKKLLITKIEEMSQLINSIIDSIWRISAELRPVILDDLGINAAIQWHIKEIKKRSGINYKLKFMPDEIFLEEDVSLAVFRIYQEAVSNIIRHSGADNIDVELVIKNKTLIMIINDNGSGIDHCNINSTDSFGLIGMRERAKLCGGNVIFSGKKGKGTTIRLEIPLI